MTDIMKLAAQWGDARVVAIMGQATKDEVLHAKDVVQSAIEALIAERDAYQQAADKMAAEHKVEREALQAENERLKEEAKQWQSLSELSLGMAEAHLKERDALQAKLDALQTQEPVGGMVISEGQIEDFEAWPDNILPDGEYQLYAAPKALEPWQPASSPPPESAGEVLVRMADGRCEIAWPTYWHGSSNAFAQWTFRDPDEDEQPVEWMTIPAHGIGGVL